MRFSPSFLCFLPIVSPRQKEAFSFLAAADFPLRSATCACFDIGLVHGALPPAGAKRADHSSRQPLEERLRLAPNRMLSTAILESALKDAQVKMILRHLLHFDLIHLIPSITLDSRYRWDGGKQERRDGLRAWRLTPAYHTVLEDAEKVSEPHGNGADLSFS